jgi:hypothetical protein
MFRTTIALLAMLLFLAPAASARPADVMPERATDHPAPKVDSLVLEEESTSGSGNQGTAPRTDAKARALAQERAYSTYGGVRPIEREPTPVTDHDDGTPWPLIGAGFLGVALMFGAAVALIARPRRARVAV